ncbi:MAG: DeoR/GlpR transcriptional regulator [Christensenellaceae bacterium]|nr:DeoR/GlpR transcriptional regulator [Christensenellaceae bacterium]
MRTVAYLRQKKLLEMFLEHEFLRYSEIKSAFCDVSVSTIKRDLKALAADGQLRLVRGGAVKINAQREPAGFDVPLNTKMMLHTEEKERIAKFAASLVEDGDVIFIDSSTTAIPIVRYLGDKNVTIVTSSINILQSIQSEKHKIVLLGGEFNMSTGSVVGSWAETMLSSIFFDKAFIGGNGFSERGGVTTPDFRESTKKKIIYKNSKIAYFLMDSSKAGKTTLSKAMDLDEANIITDKDNELLEKFNSYYIAT